MPVGVVLSASEKFDLKTLPEGFVVIRRMNYGETLERKDMMADVAMEMSTTKGRNESETARLQMKMLQRKTSMWEFAKLIVDHNITDEKERKLNFADEKDVSMLEGRIGDEISTYINKLNSFEDDPQVKN